MRKKLSLSIPLSCAALILAPTVAHASGGGGEGGDMLAMMARLVLQLGIIVMIARLIGLLFQTVKMPFPSVLIEVLAGVIIGPYMLGGIALPGFAEGIFPVSTATGIPISPELYGIATIASIIMLFSVGLETDLALLLKFSVVGLIVGTGGVLASFFSGAAATAYFFGIPFLTPGVLFLGVICTATSVGTTARILSEKRKMDSPEGVTILAGAVIDDVLGIITLTIVSSFIAATAMGEAAAGSAADSVWIVGKAIVVWLGFTAVGIIFARPFARLIKNFKSVSGIAVAALSLALVLAGVFEMAGLAMIIGAYVVGLSLSKTDLTDTVRGALETLHTFFVPVFFIVMGMLIDPSAFLSREVLVFGAIFTVVATLAKVVGCGVPTLFLNFNVIGAFRIGLGMVPRGEVSLIIAGIGLSSGVLDQKFFGAAMMMTLVADFLALPFLSILFRSDKKGVRKDFEIRQTTATSLDFSSSKLTGVMELRVTRAFRAEGFFVHSILLDGQSVYHIRKDNTHITLRGKDTGLQFESDVKDVFFIKTLVYEELLELNNFIASVKDLINPASLLKGLTDETHQTESGIRRALTRGSIIPSLEAETKLEVVEKLVEVLRGEGLVKNAEAAVAAVMDREASMSTGMQYGIALPHARTDAVDRVTVAVGLSKDGIDYRSIDGGPSKIFVLILSPQTPESSHIQILANIGALLNCADTREKLLSCVTQEEVFIIFRDGLEGR